MHNLGTFWSDLGLPNHSVQLLGWTKYPESHPYSVRFCLRLEPESLDFFFKNSLSTIVFWILCCSSPPKHIYRRGDKWSVVQSLGKDLHRYLSQVSSCAPHCCKCQSMLWRDCTIIIIIVYQTSMCDTVWQSVTSMWQLWQWWQCMTNLCNVQTKVTIYETCGKCVTLRSMSDNRIMIQSSQTARGEAFVLPLSIWIRHSLRRCGKVAALEVRFSKWFQSVKQDHRRWRYQRRAIIWQIEENVSTTNAKKQERAASRKFLAH